MRKIYLSILAIVATVALVAGATYAAFTSQATSGPNTFATGNADLKIAIDTDKDGNKGSWGEKVTPWDQYQQKNWQNLYPGWEDSYWVYLKNDSSSPIALKILPKVNITSSSTGHLWDKVLMKITNEDESYSTGEFSLRAWRLNASIYLEPTLPRGEEWGPWTVKFSVPTTAGNEIKDANITFDLVFNGIQVIE